MEQLYTFFLDYQGGTYLSQVKAKSFTDAPKIWAEKGDFDEVSRSEANFKDDLLTSIEEEKPTEIEGLIKTWCLTFTISDELALVHFVETSE